MSKTGRDKLPPTHIAIRHDLMHPANPAAAAAKLRARLSASVGEHLVKYECFNYLLFTLGYVVIFVYIPICSSRIRVLPPLEERLYLALLLASVAVLYPFPVGMHTAVFTIYESVPITPAVTHKTKGANTQPKASSMTWSQRSDRPSAGSGPPQPKSMRWLRCACNRTSD